MVRYFAGRLRDKQESASITARLDQGLSPLRRENRDQKWKTSAPNSTTLASWLERLVKETVAARVAWGPSPFQQLTAQIHAKAGEKPVLPVKPVWREPPKTT
jgi:hypothetical protein